METVPTFSVNNDNCQRQLASRQPTTDLDVPKDRRRLGKLGCHASSLPTDQSALDEQKWLDTLAGRKPVTGTGKENRRALGFIVT
jgi:hypothetical protein